MQPGGMLRVYDSCFSKPPSIRQLYISRTTCSEEVITLVMTIVGSSEPPEDYCLVEEDASDGGRILREKDYPLLVSRTSGHNGVLILRRKEDALRSDRMRRKPWVSRSKSFSGRNSSPEKHSSNEYRDYEQRNLSQFCRPLNLLPRIFRSLRCSKFMESEKRDNSLRPVLNSHLARLNSPSMRQYLRERSCSPHRMVHCDFNANTAEGASVNRSLINPHYRTLPHSRPKNKFETGCIVQEFDQDRSNWSLEPSGMASPPPPPLHPSPGADFCGASSGTVQTHLPRRMTFNIVDNRGATGRWNKAPPRPPMSKRISKFDADRSTSAATIQQRTETYPLKEAVRNQMQNVNSEEQNQSLDGLIEEKDTEESRGTSVMSNCSPFDPRSAEESGMTELERVWERTRVRKIRTVRETKSSEHAPQTNFIPPPLARDYDSPLEMNKANTERSKICSPVEVNDEVESHETTVKVDVPVVPSNSSGFEGFHNEKATEELSHCRVKSWTNLPPGPKRLIGVSSDPEECGNRESPTPPPIMPRQHTATIRPPLAVSQSSRVSQQESPNFQKIPISIINSIPTETTVVGELLKSVVSHEQKTLSTENITEIREETSSSVKLPTEHKSLSYEPRSFLSQQINVQSPRLQLDGNYSNIAAVSTDKMMTLTTPLQAIPESPARSTSKLTITLPDIPRPSSATFGVPETKSGKPKNSSAVSSRSVSFLHPATTKTNRLAVTPLTTVNETITTSMKPRKQTPPTLLDKPKFCRSNGALSDQAGTNEEKSRKWISKPDFKTICGTVGRTPTPISEVSKSHTVWSCASKPHDQSSELIRRSPYPSLFDVLHHCNILRVVLDPNIPSQSSRLGLHLELTKFPLDDIQRANSIQCCEQQQQQQQQQQQNTGSNETLTTAGGKGQYGPRGPKPRIIPREGSAFRAFDYRRLEEAPDVIAIKKIDPDSPAGIQGELAVGTLLLEINGKTLLQTTESDEDPASASVAMLRYAEELLELAAKTGRSGEASPVRITAARYHNRFGMENNTHSPDRTNLVSRRFIIGKAMTEADLGNQVISWRKTPSSVISSDAQSSRSSRAKSEISLGSESLVSQTREGTRTPSDFSQPGSTYATSQILSTDNSGTKDGLVWIPSSRFTFQRDSVTSATSTDTTRKSGSRC
ncbi:hypothetical protein FGIG_05164 [Fasciola gigantica]|uniref:PDZ domain-containing protein n=1 Tax=Fasciola gigantica TaxID=46835 RepID=A0A504YVY3_FASGI|nr:hypothetical protein FGIG_05164 [Fasciola gigantica]